MTAEATTETKIVTFKLAGQLFGIEMKELTEIREWEDPTPVPGVPSFIKGVTNLRGTVVPVVGLAERLGWEPSQLHSRSCFLVVNVSGKQTGFLVDEVADIVPLADGKFQPAPDIDIDEPGVIRGLAQLAARGAEAEDGDKSERRGDMVLLLDLNRLSFSVPTELAA